MLISSEPLVAGAARGVPRRPRGDLRGGGDPAVLEGGVRGVPERGEAQVRARAQGEVRGRLQVAALQAVQGDREAVLRGGHRAAVRARGEGGVRGGRAAAEAGAQVQDGPQGGVPGSVVSSPPQRK